MNKLRIERSTFNIVIIFIALIIFIQFYTLLLDTEWVRKHVGIIYVPIMESDYRSFLNSVWQVQTSVAILTITFITLIIGKLDTKIFGFKLNEIMLLQKSFKLNYWEKVWANTCTVAINFFYVSQGNVSAVTLVFLISSFFTLSLLRDSLSIIRRPEKFETEIENYIFQELNKAIVEDNMENKKKFTKETSE